LPGRVLWNL